VGFLPGLYSARTPARALEALAHASSCKSKTGLEAPASHGRYDGVLGQHLLALINTVPSPCRVPSNEFLTASPCDFRSGTSDAPVPVLSTSPVHGKLRQEGKPR
jgi:hypothetical protein